MSALLRCCLLLSVLTEGLEYVLDRSWPVWPQGLVAYNFSAVAVNPIPGADGAREIFVAQRDTWQPDVEDPNPILVFNTDGKFLRSFGKAPTLRHGDPHGMGIDAYDGKPYLWTANIGQHTVSKLSITGTLLAQVGTPNQQGNGVKPIQFGSVADVTFDGKGNIYVGDGDGGINNRIVRIHQPSLNVTWVSPSSFGLHSPHSVSYDKRRDWLWVADRDNGRVVAIKMDANGAGAPELAYAWKWFGDAVPWGIRVVDDTLFITVGGTAPTCVQSMGRLWVGDIKQLSSRQAWTAGDFTQGVKIGFDCPHELDVDAETMDVYVAMIHDPSIVQRYTLR